MNAQQRPDDELWAAILQATETAPFIELVRYQARQGEFCCLHGCGSGACETCPCCSAGWCVMGTDGIPENPEDRAQWLEIAAELNPIAAALMAAEATR